MINNYLCTTPLQLLNIINIIDLYGCGSINIIFYIDNDTIDTNIVEKFNVVFSKKLSIQLISSKEDYLKFNSSNRCDSFHWHSDVSTEYNFILKVNSRNKYIYEEGYSTYHKKFNYSIKNKLWHLIKRLPTYIGGGQAINGIYLYFPNLYRAIHPNIRLKILKIHRPLIYFIMEVWSDLIKIYDLSQFNQLENKKILLYATGLGKNKNLFDNKNYYDFKLIKTHPRFQGKIIIDSFIQVSKYLPLEILLFLLYKNNNKVDLIHYNCSTVLYTKYILNSYKNISDNNFFRSCYDNVVTHV